jgi:tetratricopeptide (TPR) repeat protein
MRSTPDRTTATLKGPGTVPVETTEVPLRTRLPVHWQTEPEQPVEPVADEEPGERAFSRGDYTTAAQRAPTRELKGCALIMLGELERGMDCLEDNSSPRSLLHRGLANWSLGRRAVAEELLNAIPADSPYRPTARNLLRFVGGKTFHLLLQGRDDPACPNYDLAGAFKTIPGVEVKTVGFSKNSDIVIDYTTTFEQMMSQLPAGWHPDLLLSHLVEDNPPPIGIERAAFPTLFHTQDFDRHFQHCYHLMGMFDGAVVLGSVDHNHMTELTEGTVFVFPKLLGVDVARCKATLTAQRDVDVFVSGSLFSLTKSKSRLIAEVAQLPDRYNVEMVNGYITEDDYYARLSRAKTTFTFVHRWGLINGRALEAISQGTGALVQQDGEICLMLSDFHGAVPYDARNAMSRLQHVIDHWDDEFAAHAQRGRSRVAQCFDYQTGITRYCHSLVFHVARGIPGGNRCVDRRKAHVRYPNRSPWRTPSHFDHSAETMRSLQRGFRRQFDNAHRYLELDAKAESHLYEYLTCPVFSPVSPFLRRCRPLLRRIYGMLRLVGLPLATLLPNGRRKLNTFERLAKQMLRRLLVRHYSRLSDGLERALEIYHRLAQDNPHKIAPRFNLARLYHEQGNHALAREWFECVLDDASLRFEPDDLLFWREFHDQFFDYEEASQRLIAYRKTGEAAELSRIEQFIRESCGVYLATKDVERNQFRPAMRLLSLHFKGHNSLRLTLLEARAHAGLRNPTDAVRALRRAMEIDPAALYFLDPLLLMQLESDGADVADLIEQKERLDRRIRPA